MHSRYDLMRESVVEDIDGEHFPDPLTINYQRALDSLRKLPESYTLNRYDLKKLWKKYYLETGKLEDDDILYSLNGVEHVGLFEPGDFLYKFNTDLVEQYEFKNLENDEN